MSLEFTASDFTPNTSRTPAPKNPARTTGTRRFIITDWPVEEHRAAKFAAIIGRESLCNLVKRAVREVVAREIGDVELSPDAK